MPLCTNRPFFHAQPLLSFPMSALIILNSTHILVFTSIPTSAVQELGACLRQGPVLIWEASVLTEESSVEGAFAVFASSESADVQG